jgi:hypothetical protein
MKTLPAAMLIGVALLLAISFLPASFAMTPSASPDRVHRYALTISPSPPISPGTSVTATAMSKNHDVDHVKFVWIEPNGVKFAKDTVESSHCPASDSPYKQCASDAQTLSIPGDWTLKVRFCDTNHENGCQNIVKRIHVSILVTAEFPAQTGTVIGAVAPVGVLLGYLKFGRKKPAL